MGAREGEGSISSETYSHENNEQDRYFSLYLCSDHDPLYVSSSDCLWCAWESWFLRESLRLFDFFFLIFSFRLLAYSVAVCHQKATAGLRAIACVGDNDGGVVL